MLVVVNLVKLHLTKCKFVYFTALDSTQSELFDVKAKFDEMAAARYCSSSALVTVYLYLIASFLISDCHTDITISVSNQSIRTINKSVFSLRGDLDLPPLFCELQHSMSVLTEIPMCSTCMFLSHFVFRSSEIEILEADVERANQVWCFWILLQRIFWKL